MIEVHVLASGSDGNCIVIKHDDSAVMIDAGLSGRTISSLMEESGLDPGCIEGILLTHEHTDHTSGAGVMARKLDVPVYCNERTFSMCCLGSVRYSRIETSVRFNIDGMTVTPLPTSHNAVEPNAFNICAGGRNVLVATDTGRLTDPVEEALAEADIAVLESNYDRRMLENGPYPPMLKRLVGSDIGHLSNLDCAAALKRTMNDRRKIFLAHLSRKNNTPDTARDTVAKVLGIKRINIDCLEFKGDTRVLRV